MSIFSQLNGPTGIWEPYVCGNSTRLPHQVLRVFLMRPGAIVQGRTSGVGLSTHTFCGRPLNPVILASPPFFYAVNSISVYTLFLRLSASMADTFPSGTDSVRTKTVLNKCTHTNAVFIIIL